MAKSWPTWLGVVLGIAALGFGLMHEGTPLDQWSAATRYTARVGFPLLILAYVARPLVELTRSDLARRLLARRKWIGLGFAASHTVHFICIVMLYRMLGEWPEPITIAGGGFAYVLLWSMTATSNRKAMRIMGKWWKRLHRLGIHYLWFIFAQSYLGRMFREGTEIEGATGFAVALAAAAIRNAAWFRQRKRARVPAQAGSQGQ